MVDLDVLPTDDDYVVSYDAAAEKFYMKVDADSGGSTAYDDIANPGDSAVLRSVRTQARTHPQRTAGAGYYLEHRCGHDQCGLPTYVRLYCS